MKEHTQKHKVVTDITVVYFTSDSTKPQYLYHCMLGHTPTLWSSDYLNYMDLSKDVGNITPYIIYQLYTI